jgi:alanine-synthesizing transaminase
MKGFSEQQGVEIGGNLFDRLLDPHIADIHDDLEVVRSVQRERAVEGLSVCDLSMVNPDIAPPRVILDRLLESVTKTANHRYAVSRGVRRLREAFSAKYRAVFQQELDPETQVCVCQGSKDATFHALRVLIRSGESVVIPQPSYPAHPAAVAMAGGRSVPWMWSLDAERDSVSLELVLRESGARVVLLNVPSNPAGQVASAAWWDAIGAVCARAGVTILNDFVYGEMVFDGSPAVSALRAAIQGARCVEVYSLSKAYSVPGWRVGALVGDSDVVRAVSRLKAHADYGLFLPIQYAAALALTSTENLVQATAQTYQRRLRVLSKGLEEAGWRVVQPRAGACLWAQYPSTLGGVVGGSRFSSINVAHHLLVTAGVMVSPGILCGAEFDGWIRFAAVVNEEKIRDVVRLLAGLRQAA